MRQVDGISLPPDPPPDESVLIRAACRKEGIPPAAVRHMRILRRSVDARDRNRVRLVYSVALFLRDEPGPVSPVSPPLPAGTAFPSSPSSVPPLVAGAGPAGLFAALDLALRGFRPILLERGWPVALRSLDVARFFAGGPLDPESNVQFGEGGAGTFSDGKLYTGIRDPRAARVLAVLADCGAPADILYDAHPHIGTDGLVPVVQALRQRIQDAGGRILFGHRLDGLVLEEGRLAGVRVTVRTREGAVSRLDLPARDLVLAIGHSARDTLERLLADGVPMEPKDFSLGVRIEHRQEWIDSRQYGAFAGLPALGAAAYRLATHLPDGRSVYTFCMCPGGQVVAAASEPGRTATNGMSLRARDGENANSALLVGVPATRVAPLLRDLGHPPDPGSPLSGIALQRLLEEAAFRAGGGDFRAPAQCVGDFLESRPSSGFGSVRPTYRPGTTPGDLARILPDWICDALREGIRDMDRRLRGFAHPEAVLTGTETRSSSPVRLLRGPDGCSPGIGGLYPCGEGAGYAGGILSAAVDGLRCAEILAARRAACP